MKENICWQVVDGEMISVWDDCWIPGLRKKMVGNPALLIFKFLRRWWKLWKKKNGEWELGAIEQWLIVEHVYAIRRILISHMERE